MRDIYSGLDADVLPCTVQAPALAHYPSGSFMGFLDPADARALRRCSSGFLSLALGGDGSLPGTGLGAPGPPAGAASPPRVAASSLRVPELALGALPGHPDRTGDIVHAGYHHGA